ncbi:isocitrate lyase/phosphoenolpyruvate mutase family protein [Salmonella enterica subsp. enterica]|nr:isocitrate lyase/phosphoenolpyruvate mutase family protein [Salmonella enterica subsp. enterica]
MAKAGAAALHIEEDRVGAGAVDTVQTKRSFPEEEMVDRIRAAVDARTDPNFVIMARTECWR